MRGEISVSHGEVPAHSVLPSAWQGQLEVACVSLEILFAEYPLMTVVSPISEELPCCNPNVNRTVQNIWCVPSVFCYLLFLQPTTIPFGVPGVAQSGAVYSVRQFRKCVWKSMDCTAKSSFPGLVPRYV